MQLLDLRDHGIELLALSTENHVGILLPEQRLVGGDDGNFQVVGLFKFRRLGFGRARHAGEFRVHAEVVLEGDGRERLRLPLNLDALLGLHGFVQPVAPPPPRHQASGKLIDDDYGIVHNDVFVILLIQHVRLQKLPDRFVLGPSLLRQVGNPGDEIRLLFLLQIRSLFNLPDLLIHVENGKGVVRLLQFVQRLRFLLRRPFGIFFNLLGLPSQIGLGQLIHQGGRQLHPSQRIQVYDTGLFVDGEVERLQQLPFVVSREPLLHLAGEVFDAGVLH